MSILKDSVFICDGYHEEPIIFLLSSYYLYIHSRRLLQRRPMHHESAIELHV
jgi:hypothetical protein